MGTLGFFTVYDSSLFMGHLYVTMMRWDTMYYMLVPTLWYFLLSCAFEIRLLVSAWRERVKINISK